MNYFFIVFLALFCSSNIALGMDIGSWIFRPVKNTYESLSPEPKTKVFKITLKNNGLSTENQIKTAMQSCSKALKEKKMSFSNIQSCAICCKEEHIKEAKEFLKQYPTLNEKIFVESTKEDFTFEVVIAFPKLKKSNL